MLASLPTPDEARVCTSGKQTTMTEYHNISRGHLPVMFLVEESRRLLAERALLVSAVHRNERSRVYVVPLQPARSARICRLLVMNSRVHALQDLASQDLETGKGTQTHGRLLPSSKLEAARTKTCLLISNLVTRPDSIQTPITTRS